MTKQVLFARSDGGVTRPADFGTWGVFSGGDHYLKLVGLVSGGVDAGLAQSGAGKGKHLLVHANGGSDKSFLKACATVLLSLPAGVTDLVAQANAFATKGRATLKELCAIAGNPWPNFEENVAGLAAGTGRVKYSNKGDAEWALHVVKDILNLARLVANESNPSYTIDEAYAGGGKLIVGGDTATFFIPYDADKARENREAQKEAAKAKAAIANAKMEVAEFTKRAAVAEKDAAQANLDKLDIETKTTSKKTLLTIGIITVAVVVVAATVIIIVKLRKKKR